MNIEICPFILLAGIGYLHICYVLFSEGIHVLVAFYPCPESLKYDQFKCNELIYFIEKISSHGNTQVTDGRLLAAFSQLYTDNQGGKFYNTEMKVCSLEPDRAVWTYRILMLTRLILMLKRN